MAHQSVAHTSNPVQIDSLTWTIENFTKINDLLSGPAFTLIPKFGDRFKFELNVQDYDRNVENNYILEMFLNIKIENSRLSSSSQLEPSFNLECEITLCNVNGKFITNAKTDLKKVDQNTSLRRRVLFTVFKKSTEKSAFFVPCEANKLIDLNEDKLIVKATFISSCYDKASSISSTTITSSELSHAELVKNFKTMYKSGLSHDVTFSVEGKTIPAHKAILRSRSPVFGKMLEHDMVEKLSTNIHIDDASLSTFDSFLQFLYTGEVAKTDWESILGMYSLADKYQVDSLCKECSGILSKSLAISSFCRILELSDLHSDEELLEASKVFFRANLSRVIQTGEWALLVESKPELASTVLGSCKEPST